MTFKRLLFSISLEIRIRVFLLMIYLKDNIEHLAQASKEVISRYNEREYLSNKESWMSYGSGIKRIYEV